MDEYIIHYGIKNMKWGVRKDDYHTKKGPALSTGSNGYDNPVARMTSKFISGGHPEAMAKKSSGENSEVGKKKKEEETTLEKGIKAGNAAGKIAQKGSSATKKVANATRKPKAQQDLSQLSDAELQRRVNRINLERQYNSLTQPEVKSGWDKASEILDITGDVVMIGVGLATLYKTFKK